GGNMRIPGIARTGGLMLVLILLAATRGLAAEKIVIDGSTGVMPLVAALAKAYREWQPDVTIEIGKGLGTKARLQALAAGKIDIAMASHGVAFEEIARQGMALEEIAKVAVVFGVNASVPLTDLTERQICDVYAGRITNWKELGGPDLVIAPRARPDTEVDTEVVRAKIGCLKELRLAEPVKVMPATGDMAQELAATAGAIGMTTMTVVEQSQKRIRPLSLNGIAPHVENVKNQSYGLTRDSFLVTKATPTPAVARFLAFIRSPEGAKVIAANGAVPVE
ncbi:MAG TPA: phosphate ABC transporter substrate-binding protein, partial [Thermoanaerobaculia bacterium]|nr:phosphate ABC transporter substrate-binding protein [Thermoanaerobaculia bacterium]